MRDGKTQKEDIYEQAADILFQAYKKTGYLFQYREITMFMKYIEEKYKITIEVLEYPVLKMMRESIDEYIEKKVQ